MGKHIRHPTREQRQFTPLSRQGVQHEQDANDRHGRADNPARGFEHGHHGDDPHHHIDLTGENRIGNDVDVQRQPAPNQQG